MILTYIEKAKVTAESLASSSGVVITSIEPDAARQQMLIVTVPDDITQFEIGTIDQCMLDSGFDRQS